MNNLQTNYSKNRFIEGWTDITSLTSPIEVFDPRDELKGGIRDTKIDLSSESQILSVSAKQNIINKTIDPRVNLLRNYGTGFLPGMPVGTPLMWLTDTAPDGWFIMDGSAKSRTVFADLFAVIGTTWGAGDGSTTFNIPNFKGRVAVGLDSSQSEFDTLGETGGAKTHTLTVGEMPSHGHGLTLTGGINQDMGGGSHYGPNTLGSWRQSGNSIANTGGGGAHNNLQPYIVVNFIIKY